ncbi:hypothetical protein F5B22DRAFT_657169 [Xylaria bambusicola]|uniref:uncharacterized protein n=1 Tax=Xylaria bambusicola TaxID=326684 RepID=UPI002008C0FD|nr:uncharacterized protein F5B22DRAFT_657169 [Xylaria bambusicola]KAI0525931.1 hypothetical protein F5B22DRAFT_657169 [Xylaria bambusicola]
MAAPIDTSRPLSPDSNRIATFWKTLFGKGQRGHSPPAPCSEPGLSRDSSVSSTFNRRVLRKVVPGLPRAKTFRRQQSEDRNKLEAIFPTQAERRAVSVDRRMHLQHSASYSSQLLPHASAPDLFDDTGLSAGKNVTVPQTNSVSQTPIEEKQFFSFNGLDIPSIVRDDDYAHDQVHAYPENISITDAHSINTAQYDAMIHDELEHKWILNLSMHFRDKSKREKFFVTYREKDSIWRRVTISLDYRNAPSDSLEKELSTIKYQREKSAKIYEAIRESLQDIQFYDTVTNLKLQTADGRLHVHVVEDVNEIVQFPTVRMVQHMGCRRVRESELEFDSHMSGFVYKVRCNGHTFIKKEIPGPDTIDEFLYEVNALHSLRFSRSIIEFYGVVVDDADQVVKGLLISYAEKGALIDVIYDSQERGDHELPWVAREKWARQIVQGLSDIHETGFVQGDFTLSNIVIDSFGNAKIIDINRRGCPVGWEPPEATPLIDSNQRISMYIGVKSDLYQLGMVLWALAALEDEPEAHPRPLYLRPELDVPSWYREIVDICLHENPRVRMQATTLLTKFPEIAYDDAHEERGLPSSSVHNGAPFERYVADKHYAPPVIRNVEPQSSRPCSSDSGSQATSPSFSDEPSYPPRGRSPPSPLPAHHDLYSPPYIRGNANWPGVHDITAVDDDPAVDEAIVGRQRDLEDMTSFAKMTEELDQMQEDLRAGAVLEDEQTQKTPGGNSPAEDSSSKQVVVEPNVVAGSQDENAMSLNEDESNVSRPASDITPDESSDDTPIAEALQRDQIPVAEGSLEEATDSEESATDDDDSDVEYSTADEQPAATITSNTKDKTMSTRVREPREMGSQTNLSDSYDDTDDETEDTSPTRPTEANLMNRSGLAPQKDSSPLESQGERSRHGCSGSYPSASATEAARNAEITA